MKRVFIIVLTLAAAMSMSSVYGQAGKASQFKSRIVEQAPPAVMETAGDDSDKIQRYATQRALAGTWDVVLTFSDGSIARSTLQILPGAADGEGSTLHASEFSLAPPNPTVPEQGSWRHISRNKFVASYYGYSFDEQLQPFGKIGFRHSITLSTDQDRFTGQAVFEVVDRDGKILFTDNVTSTGVRQRPVVP